MLDANVAVVGWWDRRQRAMNVSTTTCTAAMIDDAKEDDKREKVREKAETAAGLGWSTTVPQYHRYRITSSAGRILRTVVQRAVYKRNTWAGWVFSGGQMRRSPQMYFNWYEPTLECTVSNGEHTFTISM